MTRPLATRWPAAVAVSVCAHLATAGGLFVVLGSSSTPPPAPPLTRAVEVMRIGVLRRAAPSPGPVDAPAPQARTGRVTATAPRPLTVDTPEASQAALAEPGPPAAEVTDAPASVSAGAEPTSRPNTTAALGSSGTTPSAAGHAGTPAPEEGRTDAVDLAFTGELHARLAAAASECYPPQARRFRQQARVPVSFCVDGNGQPERIVVTPSGIASLDDAASSCVVARAAPFSLRARARCFTVPIDFGAATR